MLTCGARTHTLHFGRKIISLMHVVVTLLAGLNNLIKQKYARSLGDRGKHVERRRGCFTRADSKALIVRVEEGRV